ncbi:YncE family protein [Nonomuraea dietziae]|uniref:YncE family protein n=1 Tax=Nonomuraea dietziae TaxID=65515 RepID=UPI0034142809
MRPLPLVTLALTVALALFPTTPAAAADTTTSLGYLGRGGDIVTGGGKVFVAADDRIVAADSTGTVTGTITGLSGAVGLALTPDGSRLYAALTDSNQIAEIDPAALTITRRIDLASYACPEHLALAGDRLYVGHGCQTSWGGGVISLDLTAASPQPVTVASNISGAPLVVVAGGTLVAGSTKISPADLLVYDVSGTPALRGTIDANGSYLRDLALTPDGSSAITAYEHPWIFNAWDTTTLTKTKTYGTGPIVEGIPAALAVSPDGTQVAASMDSSLRWPQTGPDITLYDEETEARGKTYDNPLDAVTPQGLAFSGSDLFVVLKRGYLWRINGALLSASALSVTAPATGTALESLTLTGRLTLSENTAPGAHPLKITRRHPDGTTTSLPEVTTAADGTFTLTDTPPVGGSVSYDVLWDGNSTFRWSTATATVQVAKHSASLTLTGPSTGVVGKELQLTGTLNAAGKPIPPGTTISATRTVTGRDGTITTPLPPISPAADGSFTLTDTPDGGGAHAYTVRFANSPTFEPAEALHTTTIHGRLG